MKTRLLKVMILIICLVASGLVAYSSKPSPTPEIAIEKYVLLKGNLLEVRNLEISLTTIEDNSYGHGFIVRGYHANDGTGVAIPFFYLKQNKDGWVVTSAGTGP